MDFAGAYELVENLIAVGAVGEAAAGGNFGEAREAGFEGRAKSALEVPGQSLERPQARGVGDRAVGPTPPS